MNKDVHVKFFDAEAKEVEDLAESMERSKNYVVRMLVLEALATRKKAAGK